jgi:lipopolysaccharide biosynthesis glycosyltransferase
MTIDSRDPSPHRDDGILRIVFCANPSYFQHVAVAAVSLAANNPRSRLEIHLISGGHDVAEEERLFSSLGGWPGVSCTIHRFDCDKIGKFFVSRHISKEAYLRIFAPDVLPPEIDRVLYLDADLVVLDDLRELWHTKLDGTLLAAAPDLFGQERRHALGIPDTRPYVNSGMLLLSLDGWRREGVTARLVRHIEEAGPSLELHDQDAINAVLHDAIRIVDRRWNVQTPMFRAVRRCFPEDFEAIREACRRPAIVHFSGPQKPWLFRASTPRKRDYFRYLEKTSWRGARPVLAGLQRAEYRMDRVLCTMGVDYLQLAYKAGRGPAKLCEFLLPRLGGVSARLQRSGEETLPS